MSLRIGLFGRLPRYGSIWRRKRSWSDRGLPGSQHRHERYSESQVEARTSNKVTGELEKTQLFFPWEAKRHAMLCKPQDATSNCE